MKQHIFIHIPKTGGTTIQAAIEGKDWIQGVPNFNYRHILPQNQQSNAGDIFNGHRIDYYQQYKLFMMLRHPIDKLISEYYFFMEREVLRNFFRKKPKSLESYIHNVQTQNATINFLKGRRLYAIQRANEEDLEDVLEAIDELPIHIGLFEEFSDSLNYFGSVLDIDWPREMIAKRMTFQRPTVAELDSSTKEMILECNSLDLELYEYGQDRFQKQKEQLGANWKPIVFDKDKYDHVIPYVRKTCLLEFCLKHKKFIKVNFEYFKKLNFYLLDNKAIYDGKHYVSLFNQILSTSIQKQFPDSSLSKQVQQAYEKKKDELKTTSEIANVIDLFFSQKTPEIQQYYRPLVLDTSGVDTLVAEKEQEKRVATQPKGFLARLFKK